MHTRLKVGKELISEDGFNLTTIDYAEFINLGKISDDIFNVENRVGIVTIYINPKGRQHERFFSSSVEYMYAYAKNQNVGKFNMITIDDEKSLQFDLFDEKGKYRLDDFARIRNSTRKEVKPNFWYPIYVSKDLSKISHEYSEGYFTVFPVNSSNEKYTWKVIKETFIINNNKQLYVPKFEDGELRIYNKFYEQQVFKNIWTSKKYFPEFQGTNLLKDILGNNLFTYPKSIYAVYDSLKITAKKTDKILDYFAGSGTTGHATIKLNRDDKGNRKYILVEMGEYFNTVTKPRIQKVIYTDNWKNGKPQDKDGISQMFKYFNLESYEDTLNNLQLKTSQAQQKLLDTNSNMQEEYLLQYMLDVESRDQLLNIEAFKNPFSYKLNITENNELVPTNVDLVETFNYLIGLHVKRVQRSGAFKTVEGVTNTGDKALVIWRNLEDSNNEDLNAFVKKMDYNLRDGEFDTIYVNGDNNLANLRQDEETWKVLLLEEVFFTAMFDVKDI